MLPLAEYQASTKPINIGTDEHEQKGNNTQEGSHYVSFYPTKPFGEFFFVLSEENNF